MKDSEFIELLNLYLDHEITPAEAARLEAEVQGNPARHRVYQDYCRMQKACKLLAEDFATEPADAPARKVIAFDAGSASRPVRFKPLYYVGGLAAAAACVAIIFVGRSRPQADVQTVAPAPAIAQVAPAPAAIKPSAAPVQLVAQNVTAPANRPDRPSTPGLSIRSRAEAEVLTLNPGVQNDPHFAWMRDMRLTPIQMPNAVDQLQVRVNPALQQESRTYHSGQPLPADVPWVAIRFQR